MSDSAMTDTRIFLSPPDVGDVERKLLLEAFDSNWVAPVGPDLDAFEQQVADLVGVRHAVALASGTAALHLALVAAGVRRGRHRAGAVVHLRRHRQRGDVSRRPPGLPGQHRGQLEHRPRPGRRRAAQPGRPRAAAPGGHRGRHVRPVRRLRAAAGRLRPLRRAADRGRRRGARRAPTATARPARSAWPACSPSTATRSSRPVAAACCVTDDGRVATQTRHLATQAREPVPHYEHRTVGYNYRLSNLLAAVGRGQLQRLDEMIAARRQTAAHYRAALGDLPGLDVHAGRRVRRCRTGG